jgi:threonine dehydrogenase-like Zn-dependent dehydrogenase
VGIDAVAMRRQAALAGGADQVINPEAGNLREQLDTYLGQAGAEIIADATGVPDAVPQAMALAYSGGQVIVVGSPRGLAREVNFYDDLHRRYLEVSGAHGNMLFEPAHTRLAGAWDINKAQRWLLGNLASGRLNLEGLFTHTIGPEDLGSAYEGLLKQKEAYLGVVVRW